MTRPSTSARTVRADRHTRGVRKLLITLVVLAALLVGADFGTRAIAESQAGKAIGQRLDGDAPDVSVAGFPFLTQAFAGRYDHVTVTLANATLGTLPVSGVADLYGVTLPLSDAVSGNTDRMTADTVDLTARSPVSTVAAALGRPDLTLTAGADGAVQLTLPITVSGVSVQVTADAVATVTDGVLHLTAGKPTVAGLDLSTLAPGLSEQAAKQLNLDVPLKGLPVRIDAAQLSLDGSDLIVTASASDVKVADLQ